MKTDLNKKLISMAGRFRSAIEPINRLQPQFVDVDAGEPTLDKVRFDGRDYDVTPRFRESLKRLYKYNDAMLKFCAPATIFDRFAMDQANAPVRITFDNQRGEVLAVVMQSTPVVEAEDSLGVIQNDPRLEDVRYSDDGIIEAEFRMNDAWKVKKDSEYRQQIRLRAPVDGFSKPTISLGLIRQVCANGMWTQSTQFRSELALGHNAAIPLARILRSYNNAEGFEALRSRLDSARVTQASLNECHTFQQTASKALLARRRSMVLDQIKDVIGDPCFHYSIESARALHLKKRSLLPVQCSVLDLVNMATELGTHHPELLDVNGQSSLMAYSNRVLAAEFDLEGAREWTKSAKPLYLTRKQLACN